MKFPKGKPNKNFEDRTGQPSWDAEESAVAAWQLKTSMELGQISYRRRKEEGRRDFWEKRGLRK